MTTEVSVLKCLLCMLSLNLVILTPNTLYPYVHSVHNERSLEPKFRVLVQYFTRDALLHFTAGAKMSLVKY